MYFVNGYKFHSITYASNKSSSNSGVCVKGTNYADSASDYYGRLLEVIVIEYPRLPIKRTTLFKCEWFDTSRQGIRTIKRYNHIEVNDSRRYNQYDPFIFSVQATQVCFVPYPSSRQNSPWLVVCKVKSRLMVDIPMSDGATDEEITAAFQENEMNREAIPVTDQTPIGELNYPPGTFIDIDETLAEECHEEEDESDPDNEEDEDDDDVNEEVYDSEEND